MCERLLTGIVQLERENSVAQIAAATAAEKREDDEVVMREVWKRMNVVGDVTHVEGEFRP